MKSLLLVAALLGAFDCPNGRCPQGPPLTPRFVAYRWVLHSRDWVYLYRGDLADADLVGAWYYPDSEWHDWLGTHWGAPSKTAPLPVPPRYIPPNEVQAAPQSFGDNYGVDYSKIGQYDEYTINGRRCSKREAFEAVGAVPDDSDYLRVVIVGGDDYRRDVLGTLPQRPGLSVQDYRPDDVMIRDLGYEAGATYILTPDGRALHRHLGVKPAEQFAAAIEAAEARRRDPNWEPQLVPDLTARPKVALPSVHPAAIVAALLGVLYLFVRKR